MLTYEEAVKDLQKNHENETQFLERHKPLFPIAEKYANIFSENHEDRYASKDRNSDITFALSGGTINCLSLNLRLGEGDSIIKYVGPIIEDLKEHPDIEFIEKCEYLEIGWMGWDFKLKSSSALTIFKVRAWFGNTTKCKLVGTGKFDEIMEVQCEE